MKRIMIFTLMITFFAGCSSKEEVLNLSPIEGEGYILEATENRILVVEQKYIHKTWKDIMEEYTGEAIWLSTKTRNLKPGQKVYYKIQDGINHSYPSQAEAQEIKVLQE